MFANAGVPTLLALLAASPALASAAGLPAPPPGRLAAAFLAYFACCCGDTWASELGVLSKSRPRLVTTLREVAPGTNGAVSALGAAASALGGLLMGLCFLLARRAAGLPCSPAAPALGLLWGAAGSLLDSLLGATVQFSGVDEATGKARRRGGGAATSSDSSAATVASCVLFGCFHEGCECAPPLLPGPQAVNRPGPRVRRTSGLDALSNSAVNFWSAAGIAALGGVAGPPLW